MLHVRMQKHMHDAKCGGRSKGMMKWELPHSHQNLVRGARCDIPNEWPRAFAFTWKNDARMQGMWSTRERGVRQGPLHPHQNLVRDAKNKKRGWHKSFNICMEKLMQNAEPTNLTTFLRMKDLEWFSQCPRHGKTQGIFHTFSEGTQAY